MEPRKKGLILKLLGLILGLVLLEVLFMGLGFRETYPFNYFSFPDKPSQFEWNITEAPYTRLCSTKKILTVNGKFPGPALHVFRGDRVFINVVNHGNYNITMHWHGVRQLRNPWSDGPEYITQCPIQPGRSFKYEIKFTTEEGTIWWHAHSDWSRATVHGSIFVYPKHGTSYPFPKPYSEIPIVLGSWYQGDVMKIIEEALETGRAPNSSDAHTINGQPGDLYPCSKAGTCKMLVDKGKTYLLRTINAEMNEEMFFAVANHSLTVVGSDGSYLKPTTTDYIMITPGQTVDCLLKADQNLSHYYMAARSYASGKMVANDAATAIIKYGGSYTPPSSPSFPTLPYYNDTDAATNYTSRLRSLASKDYPVDVPKSFDTRVYTTISVNTLPCVNNSCLGPNGSRFSASMNNISFRISSIDILLAYYDKIKGVYEPDFPDEPPYYFNFTADDLPDDLLTSTVGTKVKVVEFNSTVEVVFQGTELFSGENHPMHLHGFRFYWVGWGIGNFNKTTDPKGYNLVDPPEINTVGVPKKGWAAIRFRADNPGVWFMHCHLERHTSWGMSTVFIVKNGKSPATSIRPKPEYMPPC
ncbi:laccase-15-like [Macadamia integrifolia]|uniref:laccase-15-like n=1 Tax=Macadamia integrifolia TaxID=60698 RepID=UPI001C4FCDFC|nr:laccase-15-like [Macadamia integrifolia]